MWQEYINAANLDEVLKILSERQEKARLVAGATDLILEIERGVRKGIHTLVDISRIPGLDRIAMEPDGMIHLGPLVTHNHVVASALLRTHAYPLVQAAWQVGSPQIRNRGTVAGNVITASPANDTISPLMALNAEVVLRSLQGERVVPLAAFYTGVRKTVMRPDEMLVDIRFLGLQPNQKGSFLKVALRKAQAISLVNTTAILSLDQGQIRSAVIAFGAVAPTIIRAPQAENFLAGKTLDKDTLAEAAKLAAHEAHPIDDLRGSAAYRMEMVRVACRRALEQAGGLRADEVVVPEAPVLLWGQNAAVEAPESSVFDTTQPIEITINGKPYSFTSGHNKTLLRLLREEAHLIGTKEGCGEGECGACTIYLDGKAVMGCLVPAARAHHAEIVTIEGLAQTELHPLQQSFIDAGAVQCGYCTPGLIMSGAKLLEEKPTPSQADIRQAITGNLCRCTGYYKIIEAIEMASKPA
jgi:carbon-monoxide dehydrogenase medium subunit